MVAARDRPAAARRESSRRPRRRAPGRARRAGRARTGARRPARGDTRAPLRTPRRARRRSAPANARAPRAAPIGSVWGSARRRRRGSERGGTGTPRSHRTAPARGPIRSRRRSDIRCRPTSPGSRSLDSSVTLPQWKTRPSTEPRSITRCSSGGEPIQPRLKQSGDRRRHGQVRQVAGRPPTRRRLGSEQAVVDQHRDHLLDEQRVALGRLHHPCRHRRRVYPTGRAARRSAGRTPPRRAVRGGAWWRRPAVPSPAGRPAAPGAPCRPGGSARLASTRRCARSDRAVPARPSGCPRTRRRAVARRRGPRRACGSPSASPRVKPSPPPVRGTRRAAPRRSRHRRCSAGAPRSSSGSRRDRPRRGSPTTAGEHLDDRPVRDAVAVGQALAANDDGRLGRGRRGTPRSGATSRRRDPEDRREDARAIPRGAIEGLTERVELAFTSDHRGVERAGRRRG